MPTESSSMSKIAVADYPQGLPRKCFCLSHRATKIGQGWDLAYRSLAAALKQITAHLACAMCQTKAAFSLSSSRAIRSQNSLPSLLLISLRSFQRLDLRLRRNNSNARHESAYFLFPLWRPTRPRTSGKKLTPKIRPNRCFAPPPELGKDHRRMM